MRSFYFLSGYVFFQLWLKFKVAVNNLLTLTGSLLTAFYKAITLVAILLFQ